MDLRLARDHYFDAALRTFAVLLGVAITYFVLEVLWPGGSTVRGALALGGVCLAIAATWLVFTLWDVSLRGTVIHRRLLTDSSFDLDLLHAVRIVGDTDGGVVLQGTALDDADGTYTLRLLRTCRAHGMHAISADAFDALADAIDVYDVRDAAEDELSWPTTGRGAHVERARQAAHVTYTGVHGRTAAARALRAQALFMRDGADLKRSPLTTHLFTSELIATHITAPLPRRVPRSVE